MQTHFEQWRCYQCQILIWTAIKRKKQPKYSPQHIDDGIIDSRSLSKDAWDGWCERCDETLITIYTNHCYHSVWQPWHAIQADHQSNRFGSFQFNFSFCRLVSCNISPNILIWGGFSWKWFHIIWLRMGQRAKHRHISIHQSDSFFNSFHGILK